LFDAVVTTHALIAYWPSETSWSRVN